MRVSRFACVFTHFFCRKQKRKQIQLKDSFMKMNSTWIYEKKLFFIFAPAYEWKLILNFEAIMFCLLKVRHALYALHSWKLRPWMCTSIAANAILHRLPFESKLNVHMFMGNLFLVSWTINVFLCFTATWYSR